MLNFPPERTPAEQYPDVGLLTSAEVADLLRISERKIWDLTNSGRLPAVKMGKSVRYRLLDVRQYVQACLDAQRAEIHKNILDTKTSTG